MFNLFDSLACKTIKSEDFNKIINEMKPITTIVNRLCNKIRKAGNRFVRLITEELQEADVACGGGGEIPIPVVQAIFIEYNMPILETDFRFL